MTSPLGLVKTKQNAFCSALGLYLDYDDPYVAGLTAFLCQFAFCSFPLCLCYRVNPGFNRFSTYKLPSNSAQILLCLSSISSLACKRQLYDSYIIFISQQKTFSVRLQKHKWKFPGEPEYEQDERFHAISSSPKLPRLFL